MPRPLAAQLTGRKLPDLKLLFTHRQHTPVGRPGEVDPARGIGISPCRSRRLFGHHTRKFVARGHVPYGYVLVHRRPAGKVPGVWREREIPCGKTILILILRVPARAQALAHLTRIGVVDMDLTVMSTEHGDESVVRGKRQRPAGVVSYATHGPRRQQ